MRSLAQGGNEATRLELEKCKIPPVSSRSHNEHFEKVYTWQVQINKLEQAWPDPEECDHKMSNACFRRKQLPR